MVLGQRLTLCRAGRAVAGVAEAFGNPNLYRRTAYLRGCRCTCTHRTPPARRMPSPDTATAAGRIKVCHPQVLTVAPLPTWTLPLWERPCWSRGRSADANRAVRASVQAEREAAPSLRRSGSAAAGMGRSGLGLPLLPGRPGARRTVD